MTKTNANNAGKSKKKSFGNAQEGKSLKNDHIKYK